MTASPRGGLPGTRPEGVLDEAEAAAHVREMFGRIAPRYDLLNHLLSLDIDKLWRRRVARRFTAILHDANARVLDLCCGTGDLAFAFRKEAAQGAEIIGSDFVPEMLVRARAKAATARAAVEFIESDALNLPFADASFDLVSCAFGFRNLANYERGLQEMLRVLKPGGVLLIVDHSAKAGTGSADSSSLHRIDEAYAREDFEKRGFELVGKSDVLRIPADRRDQISYKPPMLGKTDRFVLLFRKRASEQPR